MLRSNDRCAQLLAAIVQNHLSRNWGEDAAFELSLHIPACSDNGLPWDEDDSFELSLRTLLAAII